jgi:hypothetical protein
VITVELLKSLDVVNGYAHEQTEETRATPEQALARAGSSAVAVTTDRVTDEQNACALAVYAAPLKAR